MGGTTHVDVQLVIQCVYYIFLEKKVSKKTLTVQGDVDVVIAGAWASNIRKVTRQQKPLRASSAKAKQHLCEEPSPLGIQNAQVI